MDNPTSIRRPRPIEIRRPIQRELFDYQKGTGTNGPAPQLSSVPPRPGQEYEESRMSMNPKPDSAQKSEAMESPLSRFAQAYVRMVQDARYRPEAPGDGLGSINLTAEELASPKLLAEESMRYADRFIREEDIRQFRIGCSNFKSNRAFVYTIEAARLLAGAQEERAIILLRMALKEVRGSLHHG